MKESVSLLFPKTFTFDLWTISHLNICLRGMYYKTMSVWILLTLSVPKHQEKTFSLMGASRGWTSQASAHLPPGFFWKKLKLKYIYIPNTNIKT
jgi:hypothetical protein